MLWVRNVGMRLWTFFYVMRFFSSFFLGHRMPVRPSLTVSLDIGEWVVWQIYVTCNRTWSYAESIDISFSKLQYNLAKWFSVENRKGALKSWFPREEKEGQLHFSRRTVTRKKRRQLRYNRSHGAIQFRRLHLSSIFNGKYKYTKTVTRYQLQNTRASASVEKRFRREAKTKL